MFANSALIRNRTSVTDFDSRLYRTGRSYWKGHPASGAILIRSRISGFSAANIENIIIPAIDHLRDVFALDNGAGPATHWKGDNCLDYETARLDERVRNGEITRYLLDITPPWHQGLQIHFMKMACYGHMKEVDGGFELPENDSSEWNDIFIYQYDDDASDSRGRADFGYYSIFKHFNLELNEAKMGDASDPYSWASTIFHEMMHNWGWDHDDDSSDRTEYIYYADEIIKRLVPKNP